METEDYTDLDEYSMEPATRGKQDQIITQLIRMNTLLAEILTALS